MKARACPEETGQAACGGPRGAAGEAETPTGGEGWLERRRPLLHAPTKDCGWEN